jgi:hypothetical protein
VVNGFEEDSERPYIDRGIRKLVWDFEKDELEVWEVLSWAIWNAQRMLLSMTGWNPTQQ